MSFRQTSTDAITNVFDLINRKWMLITAGDESKFNTMTASWGGFGELWFKDVATVYIRHQRYTHEFMEQGDCYTLSLFLDGHRDALNLCGSVSGRDVDKVKETGLTPAYCEDGVYFEEADIVIFCKKLYSDDLKADCFTDKSIGEKTYPDGAGHTMYIGEITKVLVREK